MTKIDETILKAIEQLQKSPKTCSNLGVMLWGKAHRKPQSYARPAGRLLHEMKRRGLVVQYYDGRHFFLWKLTAAGMAKVSRKDKP
jgi:hypothetical protein